MNVFGNEQQQPQHKIARIRKMILFANLRKNEIKIKTNLPNFRKSMYKIIQLLINRAIRWWLWKRIISKMNINNGKKKDDIRRTPTLMKHSLTGNWRSIQRLMIMMATEMAAAI